MFFLVFFNFKFLERIENHLYLICELGSFVGLQFLDQRDEVKLFLRYCDLGLWAFDAFFFMLSLLSVA